MPQVSTTEFKVWKTIKLGTGLINANGFRKAIEDAGMRIGDQANNILGKKEFTVFKEPTEVNLVVLTVAELGFPKGAKLKGIYQAAKKRGLELCSAEVGPQLRIQYPDQPMGEWIVIVIGMEPIATSVGSLRLFIVGHYGTGQWLDGRCDSPGLVWRAVCHFVFVLPRKSR